MQSKIYLEHLNITVTDIHKSMHFFSTAFPHFEVRGGGKEPREWVHFGDDETYIAINQVSGNPVDRISYDDTGINHAGFVVPNVEKITTRLLAEGYKRNYPKQIEKFRIRDYFIDMDGNEFEFVEYLSTDIKEKNSYTI